MSARALAVLLTLPAAIVIAATLPSQDKPANKPSKARTVTAEERVDALSRASVWQQPAPIQRAHLATDPKQPKAIKCTFEISHLNGTAPKFDCRLPDGDKIRVKYGNSPEVPSEVASTRLLHALGFGA